MPGSSRKVRETLGSAISAGIRVISRSWGKFGRLTINCARSCRALASTGSNCSTGNWASGRPFRMRISSPGAMPARSDGLPGRVCRTITRPGRRLTTLPKPFSVERCISRRFSNCCGSRKAECGSSVRSIAGSAPRYRAAAGSKGCARRRSSRAKTSRKRLVSRSMSAVSSEAAGGAAARVASVAKSSPNAVVDGRGRTCLQLSQGLGEREERRRRRVLQERFGAGNGGRCPIRCAVSPPTGSGTVWREAFAGSRRPGSATWIGGLPAGVPGTVAALGRDTEPDTARRRLRFGVSGFQALTFREVV